MSGFQVQPEKSSLLCKHFSCLIILCLLIVPLAKAAYIGRPRVNEERASPGHEYRGTWLEKLLYFHFKYVYYPVTTVALYGVENSELAEWLYHVWP